MGSRESIEMSLVDKVIKEHIISFKELPGFDSARPDEIHPIYDLDGKSVAYYEVKLISPRGKDNGYVIVSATEDDLPVVEFSEKGKTHAERFRDRLKGKSFKMIRFGPGFISAESPRGKVLDGIGERPSQVSSLPQVRCRGEAGENREPTRSMIKARVDPLSTKDVSVAAYENAKRGYRRQKLPASELKKAWEIAKSPHSPCSYDFFWADGRDNHTYFLQVPPNTFPNFNGHSSGCGPTAWMNLFGWHDLNWVSSLLLGSSTTNDPLINMMTMNLHDLLGVFSWFFAPDQGFTWPENMSRGYMYSHSYLKHFYQDYWYRYDYKIPTDFTNYNWVFEVARSYARAKRPFIVGYYQDLHYAIGYAVAECRIHGWQQHSWAKIYPAWLLSDYDPTYPDYDDKWIPKNTIFGVWSANNFKAFP